MPRGPAIALATLVACSDPPSPSSSSSFPVPGSPSPVPCSSPSPSASASPSPRPAPSVIPTWSPLPSGSPSPPKVGVYTRSETPTFVIFFGTWCGGCVASMLSDAELAKRFGPAVRVGIALMADTPETFGAFAKGVKVPLPLEIWRDDERTRELKAVCEVTGLPMACLVDKDHERLWRGEPGNGQRVLTAFAAGRLEAATAETERAVALIGQALEPSADDALGDKALDAAAGLGGYENNVAWPLVEKGKALPFAAGLARDAAVSTGGLDFASLDTYALALFKLGHRAEALSVSTRAMAVCDALGASCTDERARHAEFRAAAGKDPSPREKP